MGKDAQEFIFAPVCLLKFFYQIAVALLALSQGLFRLCALDQIRGQAGQYIQIADLTFCQLMGPAPVCGEHADQSAVAGKQRCCLNGTDANFKIGIKIDASGHVVALQDIGEDNPLPGVQGHSAGAARERCDPLPYRYIRFVKAAVPQEVELPSGAALGFK